MMVQTYRNKKIDFVFFKKKSINNNKLLTTPGAFPVSKTSLAAPSIDLDTNLYANALGTPFFTPPSAIDSITIWNQAILQPINEETPSICFSGISSIRPSDDGDGETYVIY